MTHKNLILSLLSAVMICGCTKNLPSDSEIAFSSELPGAVETKAFTETVLSSLQSSGFKVAAVVDANNAVKFNEAVNYSGGTWKPSSTHYYPATGTMSFYAAYPASQAITVTGGAASLRYSQNPDMDLMVAKTMGVAKSKDAVPMGFVHILSQFNVKCKGLDTAVDYVLTGIRVAAPNGATYSYADGTWSDKGTDTEYTYFSGTQAVPTASATAVGSAMSFIPGPVTITVNWYCKNKGTGAVVGPYEQDITGVLKQGFNSSVSLLLPNSQGESVDLAPEMVDLGLPSGLKWAKCNIGAEKEEDYGLYFKWGETEGKTSAEASYFQGSAVAPGDFQDAATAAYGAGYRMPTKDEMQELIDGTDREAVTINGVKGIMYSSKSNSNHIFIPLAGYMGLGIWGISFVNAGTYGYVLSSTLADNDKSLYLYCNYLGNSNISNSARNFGYPVRAVHE